MKILGRRLKDGVTSLPKYVFGKTVDFHKWVVDPIVVVGDDTAIHFPVGGITTHWGRVIFEVGFHKLEDDVDGNPKSLERNAGELQKIPWLYSMLKRCRQSRPRSAGRWKQTDGTGTKKRISSHLWNP